jgi:hypothetical protein
MATFTVNGAVTSYRSAIVSGENTLLLYGQAETFSKGAPVVMYFHSASANELQPITGYTSAANYVHYLARHGYIVASANYGGSNNWGNAASSTVADSLYTWATANLTSSTSVGLWGVSMGFMTAVNWWNANQTKVGAVLGVVPVANASNFYTDNAGAQASMDAAYAGSFATNGSSRSPHLVLPSITGTSVKLKLYYSSTDASVRPADTTAMASTAGCSLTDLEPAVPSGHAAFNSPSINQPDIVAHFGALTP